MWIELPDNLAEILEKVTSSFDKKITATNALFDSMRRCQHIIYAKDSVLNSLKKHKLISQTNKDFIDWIQQKYVYVYECSDLMEYKIVVVLNEITVKRVNNVFQVPLEYLEEIQVTKLLCENENDASMFLKIFNQIFLSRKISRNFFVRLENHSFHGGNAATSITEVTKEEKIVLAIVDTDKSYPNEGRGSTCIGARNAFGKVKETHIIELYELGVREKENLFPPQFYLTIPSDKKEVLNILHEKIEEEDFIKYADIKEGVKYCVAEILDEKAKTKTLNDFYSEFVSICKNKGIFEQPEKSMIKKENFICVAGIGSKMCDLVSDVLLETDQNKVTRKIKEMGWTKDDRTKIMKFREKIIENIPLYLYKEWEEIYNNLFSWGCCISKDSLPMYESIHE